MLAEELAVEIELDIESKVRRWPVEISKLRKAIDKRRWASWEIHLYNERNWFMVKPERKEVILSFKIIRENENTATRVNDLIMSLVDFLATKYSLKVTVEEGSKLYINKISNDRINYWQFRLKKFAKNRKIIDFDQFEDS